MQLKSHRFLIELDCLLDTRLSTLNALNPAFPEAIIERGYHVRQGDFFDLLVPDIDMAAYKAFYASRGSRQDILKTSLVTFYIARLLADIEAYKDAATNSPDFEGIAVDVNTWPYSLTTAEDEELKLILREMIPLDVIIKTTSIPIEHLTPSLLKENWVTFTIYDFDAWLQRHHGELKDNPMPGMLCITPRLLREPITKELDTDPTMDVTAALVQHIALEWVPLREVSVFTHIQE